MMVLFPIAKHSVHSFVKLSAIFLPDLSFLSKNGAYLSQELDTHIPGINYLNECAALQHHENGPFLSPVSDI